MVSTVKAQSGLRTAIHQAARHRSAPEARSRPHAGFWKKETAVGASPGEAPLTIFQAGLGGAGDTERWRGQGWWLEGVQGQGSDPEAFPSAWKTCKEYANPYANPQSLLLAPEAQGLLTGDP